MTVAFIAIKLVYGVITSMAARAVAGLVMLVATSWQLCGSYVAAVVAEWAAVKMV